MKTLKEYRKTATVKAKLFEKGDEDGMIPPQDYTLVDAMENDRYRCPHPDLVPYISTLENQKHRGEFGKHYLCVGIDNERWLVDKDIFEKTYECIQPEPANLPEPEDVLLEKFPLLPKSSNKAGMNRIVEAMQEYARLYHEAKSGIDWEKIKRDYMKKCVDLNDPECRYKLGPHDLFEWFKSEIQKQTK